METMEEAVGKMAALLVRHSLLLKEMAERSMAQDRRIEVLQGQVEALRQRVDAAQWGSQ